MKKLAIILIALISFTAYSQNFTKGYQVGPGYTTAQMNAISSPAIGRYVYNSDTDTQWRYNGTIWVNTETGGGLGSTDIDTYSELNTIVADVTLTHNGLIDTFTELNAVVADQSLVSEDRANTFASGNTQTFNGNTTFGNSNNFQWNGLSNFIVGEVVGQGIATFNSAAYFYNTITSKGLIAMQEQDQGAGNSYPSNFSWDNSADEDIFTRLNAAPAGSHQLWMYDNALSWRIGGQGNAGVKIDQTNTAVRTYTLPDKDGTFAMISDISGGGTDDQTAAEVSFTPSGDIASTDVQAGIVELDSEKVAIDPLSPYQDITLAIGTTAAMDAAYGVDPTIPNGHIYWYTDSETTAVDIGYDNTTSGLTATNVKAAIDEVAAAGGGATDHGALTGLADDDHPQYALDTDLSNYYFLGSDLNMASQNITNGNNITVAGVISASQIGATDGNITTNATATTQIVNYQTMVSYVAANGGSGTFSGSIADNQIAVGSGPDALEGNPNFTYDSVGNIFKLDSQSGAATDFIQEHEFGGSTYRNTIDGINSSSYWTWQNLTNGQQQQIAFGSTSLRPVQNDSLDLGANLTAWKNIYGVELHDTDGGNSTEWTTTRSEWQSHLTALGSLTSLAEANLVDKEIRYVENAGGGEYAVYAYDATAVSGDAAPLDQTGGTGFWQKIASSSFQASAFNDDETVVQDNLDNTKQLQFNLDAIGSGVTRTITMLDENVDLSALTASNLAADAVSDSEIDYTNVTLADFTNDANLVASVGSGRTGVIPIKETYAQSQANFDLDGAPPANHHVVITDAQVTSAEIEDATIVDADMAAVPNPANATVVDLSSILGNRYVASANAATTYTTTGLKAGGWAKVLINAASEPAVTGGTKIAGSTFAVSTDMYMVVYTDDGTNVEFYFLEI